ncbi:Abhd17b, partial [Symbiodinium sp. KB8]
AAAIVRGEVTCYSSDGTWGRRVCYIVLFCGSINEPFITFSKHVYFKYVKTGPGGTWDPESVSHGFASQSEAEAFCYVRGGPGGPSSAEGPMTSHGLDYLGSCHTAEAVGGYSKLWFSRGGICSQAFVVKAIPAGFILCLPQGAINDEELEQATDEQYTGNLGPWTQVNIIAVGTSGRELKKTVPCLLIDMQAAEAPSLSIEADPALAVKPFGVVRLQSVWPSRVRTLEALEFFLNGEDVDDRLEAYFTATGSEPEVREAPAAPIVGADRGTASAASAKQLPSRAAEWHPEAAGQPGRDREPTEQPGEQAQPTSRELRVPPVEGAPAWAPQLFADGSRANLGSEQMHHLLSLAGRGPKRLGDLGSSTATAARAPSATKLGATPKARTAASPWGDLPEEEEELDDAEPEDAADQGDVLSRLLAQQTKILTQLAKKSRDPLHGLLSGSVAEDDSKLPGVKGMAARQLMIEQFEIHFAGHVLPLRRDGASLGTYKTLTYFSFLLAEMWEAVERGQAAEMISLLALGLVFAEQVANEQGHTRLGWLLTGRQDPPFAQVEQRRAPRPEVPHGMLADPRWIAANLACLRDADLISERTNKSQQPPAAPSNPNANREDPKGSSKGRRGQRKQVVTLHFFIYCTQFFEYRLAVFHRAVALCIPSTPGRAGEPTSAPEPPVASESVAVSRAAPVTSNMAIEPSRLNFEEAPKFVANRFLTDPLLRAGLQDPRAFRLPSCQWPRPKLARVHCNRQKQLELFRKWDGVHCLHLIRASDSEYRFRCGLFAVYKSEAVDRQIGNPTPENSRSFSVSEAAHTLAHSSLLCQLYIPRNQALTISSDDLTDFYHGFLVDASHAARNHLHGVFQGEEFAGWNCFRTELLGADVVGCFRTLAMGTNYAVEVAQHAHGVLLYRAGCLREHERVAYRGVFPKGPGFDMLCIDDHVFLLLVDLSEVSRTPSLRVSAKKKVRYVTQATVLGGELDGLRGDLAAPRLRTAALGGLTFQLVLLGYCTKDLLQCIVGCWVFICMFRRLFMCLMTQVYHEMKNRAGNEVFKLSHDARQELLMLVLLSPCMFTDLRAPPLDRIFCTDASGYAAGACHSYISRSACLDLLRYADHKGYHTALLPKSAELSARLGDQDGFATLHQDLPPQLDEGVIFDFMEVFRGEGRLTQVAVEMGLRVHPGFDIMDGQGYDILSSACFDQVVGLVCRRVVAYVHLGMALRVAFVLSLAAAYGILGSAEQPVGSTMFSLDAIFDLRVFGREPRVGEPLSRYSRYLAAVKLADDRKGSTAGWASGLSVVMAGRRSHLFQDFRSWAELEFDCSFDQLCSSGLLLGTVLVAYGKFLFYGGSPKYVFSETINACTDHFKHYRQFFASAWAVLTRWQEEEPGERSMVLPVSVFKAAVALALLWSWPLFAAGLLLGFNGLLRPKEFLLLRRRDLILPRDVLSDLLLAYVRILGAKTRRYMQRQHAKISDALAVTFLSALFSDFLPDEPLFNCSPFVFRSLWNAVFRHLGVSVSEGPTGVTPKCLRGSGATWMYQLTEDIPRIQWRGRWQQRRTLEYYLQDVAGQLLLADLAESHRSQICELASASSSLMWSFSRALQSSE